MFALQLIGLSKRIPVFDPIPNVLVPAYKRLFPLHPNDLYHLHPLLLHIALLVAFHHSRLGVVVVRYILHSVAL